jgi:hypothetical protein
MKRRRRIISDAHGASKMFRIFLSCIAVLSLSACMETTSNNSVVGPSGTPVNMTKCSSSPTGCLKQAADTCAGPYQVLDSDTHSGGLAGDVIPGPVTWYGMTYRCGPSDGKMPTFAFRGQQSGDSSMVVVNSQPGGVPASDAPVLRNITPPTVRCQTMGAQTVCR